MSNKNGIAIVENYWCHTARPVRLAGVNGALFAPLLLVFFHPRPWTFYAFIASVAALTLLERRGYSLNVCLLLIRSRLSGNRVSAIRRVGVRRIWAR